MNGSSGGKGGSGRGSSGRTRDKALHCPERPGAVYHSVSAIRYPCLGLDCMMGQPTVIMGGVDDGVVNDVDINDAKVARRRRRRIRRLELRSSPR